jgi:hypothetical protein
MRFENGTLAVTEISNRLNSSKHKSRSVDFDKEYSITETKIIKQGLVEYQ